MVHYVQGTEGCTRQILHGSATPTEAVGRAIQHSQESLRVLAKRHGINQKTVAKRKQRTSVADNPTGPKDRKSTVLSISEEAILVAFGKHTLLPLEGCPLCPAAALWRAAAVAPRPGPNRARESATAGCSGWLRWPRNRRSAPCRRSRHSAAPHGLASPRAGYITGTIVTIDGGIAAHGSIIKPRRRAPPVKRHQQA
jgi:hypothetical protein